MAADTIPGPRELTARRRPGLRRGLWLADHGSGVLCGLAIVLLASLLLAFALGYRSLIDYSGSMRPAIQAGDLVVTHPQPAMRIRVGDIVSFDDPALHRKLVTHRVVLIRAAGPRIEFVTRGDANTTPESWSVRRAGSVAVMQFRITGAGRVLAWLVDPWVRTILLTLAALVLSTALLRRIWRV
jgi:signal peptidase I